MSDQLSPMTATEPRELAARILALADSREHILATSDASELHHASDAGWKDWLPHVDALRAAGWLDHAQTGQQWQPIETAPHAKRVLLGWYDWRDHQWCVEASPATTGQRFDNGYSTLSQHGSATHWQPLPAPPDTSTVGNSPIGWGGHLPGKIEP